MKRVLSNEMKSCAALWGVRIAFLALTIFIVSIFVMRAQLIDVLTFGVLAGFCSLLVVISLILSLIGSYSIWQEGLKGCWHIAGAFIICAGLLCIPAFIGVRILTYPILSDISTDLSGSHALVAENRLLQKNAYPDIVPLFLDITSDEALDIVLSALQNRGLTLVDKQIVTTVPAPITTPPMIATQKGRAVRPSSAIQPTDKTKDKPRESVVPSEYRVQALGRSFIVGLPIDIAIRLHPKGDGTRIDFRFSSRNQHHDLGEKAYLMRKLSDEIKAIATAP